MGRAAVAPAWLEPGSHDRDRLYCTEQNSALIFLGFNPQNKQGATEFCFVAHY